MISDLHFLRPAWLLAIPTAIALGWLVSRRESLQARWRGIIAPHLLAQLVVERRPRWRLRPLHLTVALIALGGLAAAGPTWTREGPPFVEDTAPLAIALDLSRTMDAIDVPPTRIERAKLKVRDLLERRKGGRTAIFAYAGSAHLVLPLTDDAGLVRTYVDALATGIMPVPGKDTARALATVEAGLAREETPGTILFLTDGVEPSAVAAFRERRSRNEVMVLGVGTAHGGPVKTGEGEFLADASGRVTSRLDVEALRRFGREAGVPVATVSLDDADVDWIQRHAQAHLREARDASRTRWRDVGWYLCIPIVALGALWFRRGWTIRWAAPALLAAALPRPAHADPSGWRFADVWLTHDQQGRLAYQRGDYAAAAERFTDPMWKGTALYRAGKYAEAVEAFARADSAEARYDEGNALARLGKLTAAVARYQEALKRRPDFPDARKNLELVRRLIPRPDEQEQPEEGPNQGDRNKEDEKGKEGGRAAAPGGAEEAELWMRNIQTTPTELLQRKFALQARRGPP